MPRQTLKQRPDGRYTCKYKGKCFYGSTQSEALAERKNYKRMIEQGIKDLPLTVRQYAARWLPVHKAGIGQKTYMTMQSKWMCSVNT